MKYLNYIDLSNNTFDASTFPSWLSNLQSLTTMVMENTRLYGPLPGALFNLSQLQTVSLSNNQLNGTLDIRSSYGNQLELVDLQNNSISDFIFTERVGTSVDFILVGNPACTETQLSNSSSYCVIPPSNSTSYSTPPNNCTRHMCSSNEVPSPNCRCAYPYTGILIFRAPSFSNLGNSTIYTTLESKMTDCFRSNQLPADSVSLSSPTKTTDNNLLISLEVFPYGQDHFNRTGISGIAFVLNSKTFMPPITYGTFSFRGNPYNYFAGKTGIGLDWMRRLRIALGAARGLQYLHELANPPIIHRDIKSSNVLLDERLNPKVSDFGLSKPMGDAEKSHISTQVKGTMGYMDPEYYMTQQLTEKSDVYSFGVVLLELVTARQPIEKGKYFVSEVRQRMKRDQVLYSLDKIIGPTILAPTPKGLEQFVDLAMRCVEEEGAQRHAMGVVVKEIENIMQIAGLNPNADSTFTSTTHEGDGKGNHPYTNDSLFVYSGTFPLASN